MIASQGSSPVGPTVPKVELPHPLRKVLEVQRLRMNLISRRSRSWVGTFLVLSVGIALVSSCATTSGPNGSSSAKGTPEEANKFIEEAEKRLLALNLKVAQADWVKSTFITSETEALSANANNELIAAVTDLAERSRRFDGLELSPDTAQRVETVETGAGLTCPQRPNRAR